MVAVQRGTKHKFLVVHQGDRVQLRGQMQSYGVGGTKRDCYFHKGITVDWDDLSGRPVPSVLTVDLARELFRQSISIRMPELMNGETIIVEDPKTRRKWREDKEPPAGTFHKADASEIPHEYLKCPCHGVPMRLKKNSLNGGDFWGCGSFDQTRCKITYRVEDLKLNDPDNVLVRCQVA